MKKKVIVLVLAGLLTVSGVSLAYAAGNNSTDSNKFNGQMMNVQNSENYRGSMMSSTWDGNQSYGNSNKMIELMKENGFTDEANAMENGDFNAMNKLMTNLSDDDYNKMIDVMKNNGYESMANIMQSVGKEKMVKFHQSMMEN